MRKIYLLFVGALCLSLTSCLKGSEYKESPVAPGLELYSVVSNQNGISLDPANVAFRLNILLTELDASTDPNATIDKITVEINKTNVNLLNQLFGVAKITNLDANTGKYEIAFDQNRAANNDYPRSGSIIITTNNKLLGSMSPGDSWTITKSSDPLKMFVGSRSSYNLSFSGYTITCAGSNEWNIHCSNFDCFDESLGSTYRSEWSFEYVLTQSKDSQMYADIVTSDYSLMCNDASGTPVSSTLEFRYTTFSPLLFKASCRNAYAKTTPIYGGSERVDAMNPADLNIKRYPSSFVKVQWKAGDKDCSVSADVTYNGLTETIQ